MPLTATGEVPGSIPVRPRIQRSCRVVTAIDMWEPTPGVFIFDFGRHKSGWSTLHATGRRGTTITLRHAGAVFPDRRLDARNNLNAAQTDTYILRGGASENWEPRFTLHGSRYVEVTGHPGKPSRDAIRARDVRRDLPIRGHFQCSDELVNPRQQLTWRSRLGFA